MAVGLKVPENVFAVKGVALSTVAAGIKSADTKDMVLFSFDEGAAVAGVFTKNAFCAAPVTLSRKHIARGNIRGLLINSGNANAGTGLEGMRNANTCCEQIAEQLSIDSAQILPFSTGVISQQLPMGKLSLGISLLRDGLNPENWLDAAFGIMTTDTQPKIVSRKVKIGSTEITITGISKGAGMIKPDMATMLAFIATDASVDDQALQSCLNDAVQSSFNAITIDGDTSTNDSCILVATGQAGDELLDTAHADWSSFQGEINTVCELLAQAIVRDGEGATKFITLNVSGGEHIEECRQVAYTIAHSPLVKTAFFASDANIGRLLAAIGRSGLHALDISLVNLSLDEVAVVEAGEPAASYTEERGQMAMSREEITVHIELGRGDAHACIWTTDLSHDYVSINADYRS